MRNRIDEYVHKKMYENMYTQSQTQHLQNVHEEQPQYQQHSAYAYSRAYSTPQRSF